MGDRVSTGFQFLEDDVTGDPTGLRRARDGKTFPLAPVSGAGISDVTYNGQSKVASYKKGSDTFTVAYPDATTAVITSSAGDTKTVTFDAQGRVSAII